MFVILTDMNGKDAYINTEHISAIIRTTYHDGETGKFIAVCTAVYVGTNVFYFGCHPRDFARLLKINAIDLTK